jgi:hypothetical protein
MRARTKEEWRRQVAGARTRDDIRALLDQLSEVGPGKLEKLWHDLNWIADEAIANEGKTEEEAVRDLATYMSSAGDYRVWDGQHR